jgi:hypothetical protein
MNGKEKREGVHVLQENLRYDNHDLIGPKH